MLRSAASPGSVGFGRHGSGASGLLMTPFPAGHLASRYLADTCTPKRTCRLARKKGRPQAPRLIGLKPASLDLGFAKLDVFLRHRIVFLLHQFVGHGARILARDVIETGIGAGNQLDLDRSGFRHGWTSKWLDC